MLLTACALPERESTGTGLWEAAPADTGEEKSRSDGRSGEAGTAAGTEHPEDAETDEAADGQGRFYERDLLSESERSVYEEVLQSLVSRTEVQVSTTDAEVLDKVYNCVLADHPEIFYTAGYTCTTRSLRDTVLRLDFAGNYTCTREEQEAYQERIDAAAEAFPAGTGDMDDYHRVKAVYEYVIAHTEYDTDAENSQNIVSALVDGRSVCTGYAKTAQYLLQRLGMEAVLVTGQARGGRHAWIKVLADGDWYNVDPTWGDASFLGGDTPDWMNYEYLLVTDADIDTTHTMDEALPLPACTAEADNYYVREGLWFERWDEAQFGEIAARAAESSEGVIRLRCGSDAVYQEMMQDLITDQGIYRFLPGVTSIRYTTDEELRTLTVIL